MRLATRSWLFFAVGTICVLGAMGWVSAVTLGLDRAERHARCEAAYQESIRLSLWRMDSWLAPQLAPEAGRPYFEYLPYYAQERAYTRLLNTIELGEVLTPSPLLTFESDYFPLHFQVDTDGSVSSPQVPEGNLRDLAESTLLDADRFARKRRRLEELGSLVARTALATETRRAESCVLLAPATEPPAPPTPQTDWRAPAQQEALSKAEWAKRAQSTGQVGITGAEMLNRNLQLDEGPASVIRVGPLVPLWLDATGEAATLVYVRRVQVDAREILQGLVVDWPRLREALLGQIADLFDAPELVPVALERLASDPAPTALATLPASLDAPRQPVVAAAGPTPLRVGLAVTWLVVLVTLGTAAFSLRSALAYGERRSRFASAVTHELRTPLTTFRMYSEMLADGMVSDEGARREYLETLKNEAQRLGTLVENVLAYARLERGRATRDRHRVRVATMMDRIAPRLEQRASSAGLQLESRLDAADDVEVEVDVEAVGQILLNLVDNACKYAAGRPMELLTRTDDGRVLVEVRDHGPGVPANERGHIFRPFERGRRNGAAPASGIGLGLALSRGLARDLGGDLRLAESTDEGSCFELSLPRVH